MKLLAMIPLLPMAAFAVTVEPLPIPFLFSANI